MEKKTSWRHEGGHFHRHRSQSGDLRQPLVGSGGDGEHVLDNGDNPKHVRWSPSTRSFYGRDLEADRPPDTGSGGEYVKSIVYGGLDAIVTSFALVASVSGGGIGSGAVLVLGFANLIADGISMGFGDFLSTTTERNYASNEQKIAEWEVNNDLHAQALNMIQVYEMHGMDQTDAEQVVNIFSKYKDLLANQKLTMQDGLLPPDDDEEPWKNGLVTFISFLCFGCTPLISFVVLNPFTKNVHVKFGVACFVTALALVILGVAKARLSGERWLSSVLMVLGNGGLAAAAAYGISWCLNNVFGLSEP